jgi:hypothetical protein
MKRALLGTAVATIALLVMAEPANAATVAPASLGSATVSTDRGGFAQWISDVLKTPTGFKVVTRQVSFDVSSTAGASTLFVSSCVDYYDSTNTFTKETCTSGQVTRFAHAFAAADLSRASVSAPAIPVQTCSTDANFQPIGPCRPAGTVSVKASWTGLGPITYTSYTQYTPGVYRLVQRTRDRKAGASATINGKSPTGTLFADISSQITKEWGNPCGGASGSVVPNGC